jgi:hypothetical protein
MQQELLGKQHVEVGVTQERLEKTYAKKILRQR